MITVTHVVRHRVRQAADAIFATKSKGYIHPRHVDWEVYQNQKHEASVWLTARNLLRLSGGTVPDWKEVLEWVEQGMNHHSGPGQHAAKRLACEALRRLVKVSRQLENNPGRFAAIPVQSGKEVAYVK